MTPAIPAGYRRLRVGEEIKEGDKFKVDGCPWLPREDTIGEIFKKFYAPTIRRIAPVARKGGKKGRARSIGIAAPRTERKTL